MYLGSHAVQSVMAQGVEAKRGTLLYLETTHKCQSVFREAEGSTAGIAPSVMVSYTPEGLYPNLESEDPASSFL